MGLGKRDCGAALLVNHLTVYLLVLLQFVAPAHNVDQARSHRRLVLEIHLYPRPTKQHFPTVQAHAKEPGQYRRERHSNKQDDIDCCHTVVTTGLMTLAYRCACPASER